jgi:hypothetical protein
MARAAFCDPHNIQHAKKNVNMEIIKILNVCLILPAASML